MKSFLLNEMIPDMFKCFVFIQEMTVLSDKEIQTILQNLVEKCKLILNLRSDAAKIETKHFEYSCD